jgi:hypothetical protein
MTSLRRNAPCHCGSGRKYKRCCFAKDAAARAPGRPRAFTQRERKDASTLLDATVLDPSSPFRAGAPLARIEFFGEQFAQLDEAYQERAASSETCAAGFVSWLALDRPIVDDHTPCMVLLEVPNARLSPGQRIYLERLSQTRMGVYEVRDVRYDVGVSLADLWTNEVHEVSERLGTHSLVPYDVLGARLVKGPFGDKEIDGVLYPFNQHDAEGLLATLRAEWKREKKKPGADEWKFLKRSAAAIINRFWVHHVLLRPLPELSTTDGEPVELCKVIFDVNDETAVRAALESESSLDADDEGGYVWFESGFQGGEGRRILASLKLSPKRLVAKTMNRARAERARELLERLAGSALRHRFIEHVLIERALAEYRKRSEQPQRESEMPAHLEREIYAEYQNEYYRRWLDEPVPALGGRTPRNAARLKAVRPKLIRLLKELERSEARRRIEGRPSIDIAWMWRELGLTN